MSGRSNRSKKIRPLKVSEQFRFSNNTIQYAHYINQYGERKTAIGPKPLVQNRASMRGLNLKAMGWTSPGRLQYYVTGGHVDPPAGLDLDPNNDKVKVTPQPAGVEYFGKPRSSERPPVPSSYKGAILKAIAATLRHYGVRNARANQAKRNGKDGAYGLKGPVNIGKEGLYKLYELRHDNYVNYLTVLGHVAQIMNERVAANLQKPVGKRSRRLLISEKVINTAMAAAGNQERVGTVRARRRDLRPNIEVGLPVLGGIPDVIRQEVPEDDEMMDALEM